MPAFRFKSFAKPVAVASLALALAILALPRAGFAYTQEEQQACTPDAMRLCGEFVPNVDAITACMIKKKAQLPPRTGAARAARRQADPDRAQGCEEDRQAGAEEEIQPRLSAQRPRLSAQRPRLSAQRPRLNARQRVPGLKLRRRRATARLPRSGPDFGFAGSQRTRFVRTTRRLASVDGRA